MAKLIQASLFAGTQDPVLAALREIDVDATSAEELAARVKSLQRELEGK